MAAAAAQEEKHEKVACPCDPKAPLVAYVFKVVADKPMDLYFVRVYSGTLKASSRVFNPVRDRKENISRMFRIFAKKREQVDRAEAGDIVAIMGIDCASGDTFCSKYAYCTLQNIYVPEPVVGCRGSPRGEA